MPEKDRRQSHAMFPSYFECCINLDQPFVDPDPGSPGNQDGDGALTEHTLRHTAEEHLPETAGTTGTDN